MAALNGLGLGPFRATLTGEELRRAGLLAMARVADVLAPGAEHVIFGHTHRPGPLPGDEQAEWTTLSGTRLWNTGSWLYEGAFITTGRESPYWPGTVLTLDDEGPPRLENVLAGDGSPTTRPNARGEPRLWSAQRQLNKEQHARSTVQAVRGDGRRPRRSHRRAGR